MTIQHVNSKGRLPIIKLQNFTVHKRQSFLRMIYGTLLVIIAVISAIADPVDLFTNWYLRVSEGSFVLTMWEKPTYVVHQEVWAFNYTNHAEYLSGQDKILKVEEVGPFVYQEIRANENPKIDRERGVMTFNPKVTLKFLRNESIADPKDVFITVPNITLIAISTFIADNLGYLANIGAYYSISGTRSELFQNLTVDEFSWGHKDPIVTVANSLLPGWIDFAEIGVLDRFYAQESVEVEVELKDEQRKYSLNKWDNKFGLKEQGFTDLNSSTPCNRIKGSYEGLLISPNWNKDRDISVLRKQACRLFPFEFQKELQKPYGFKYYRYAMNRTAFNKISPYACECNKNCLPDGFVDVSGCYYGFPIALSKPNFQDVDPQQQSYFEGMNADPEKYASYVDFEPITGAPLSLSSHIQANIAVRTSTANPITKPIKNKVMPLMRFSMSCKEPPASVINLLRLRFVIAPPLIITLEVLLFIAGIILAFNGFYKTWKHQYKLIQSKPEPSKMKHSSIVINDNRGFTHDDLAKQAVSLLAIKEEYHDAHDLVDPDT